MIKYALLLLASITFALPSLAQESTGEEPTQKWESKKYSPDYCEFTATFPEEPFVTNRCENPEDPNSCFNLISYTKVFDLSATITVELICSPSTPKMYEQFTPEVMENTVRAMTEGSVVEAYKLNTRQDQNYRQTGLVGKGRKGLDETIYLAQLWLGQNSIMSVEAQISGDQMDEADKTFADILSSIGHIQQIEENKAKKAESVETETESAPKQ